MKQIDRCDSCKYLKKEGKYNKCYKLEYELDVETYGGGALISIYDPKEFGCIAWEAKDERA